MSEDQQPWMQWAWEWDDITHQILARDPEYPDDAYVVVEEVSDEKIANLIIDSRDVLLNIEALIDSKIQSKRMVFENAEIVLKKGADRMQAALLKALRPSIGRKLTKARVPALLDRLFEELSRVVEVKATATAQGE